MRLSSLIILLLSVVGGARSLIAYDCSHPTLNMTTIAINQIPDCTMHGLNKSTSSEEVQLVQLSNSYPVHVYQCKVIIHRVIAYCGMSSHNSLTRGGLFEYLKEITRDECMLLQSSGSLVFGANNVLVDIPRNGSKTFPTIFAGELSYDGTCKGTSYSDITGSFEGVVVHGYIKVTIADYEATADTLNNKIKLRSGLVGSLTDSSIMDVDAGYTFWTTSELTQCDSRLYTVLYQGVANKVIEKNVTTYVVEQGQKVFALTINGYYSQCQVKAYLSEHPKLIIVPKSEYGFYFEYKPSVETTRLDLMTYINTKIIMLEKHIGSSLESLFEELSLQRCRLERKTLNNLRSLALINPQLFAYTYMDQPGYTAIGAGEVIHIMKCVPVEVRVRRTSVCYLELPVNKTGKNMFMIPNSRLLQEYGTEVDCDLVFAPQYLLEDGWYAVADKQYPVRAPKLLTPEPLATWSYTNIKDLARSGIYTYEETERLQERIMYPYERTAIANILTRGVSQATVDLQGINIHRIFTDRSLEVMKDKLLLKIWGWFSFFGQLSAGAIGVYVCVRCVKFVVDLVIHGTILYDLYGWSFALIGSLWNSVTTFLIQRRHRFAATTANPEDQGQMESMEKGDATAPHTSLLVQEPVASRTRSVTKAPSQPAYVPLYLRRKS